MPSHRHHYVPQFYLKNFGDPRIGQLWRYPKGSGKPIPGHPKVFAFENHYHTFTRPNGTRDSDTIEGMFAALEGEAALAIGKILAAEKLSDAEREVFITFAGAMLVRVPRQRDHVGTMMGEIAKHMLQASAFHRESFHADYRRFQEHRDTSDVDPEAVRQAFLSEEFELQMKPQAALGMSLGSLETVVDCLLSMNWIFVRRQGRFCFITCDAPVFCVDPTLPPDVWYGAGLRSEGMEVSLPLSPEIAAIGSYHLTRSQRGVASPEMVRRLNQMRVDAAYRYIFAHHNSEALERFIVRNCA